MSESNNNSFQDLGVELRFIKAVITDLIYSQQRIEKQLTEVNETLGKLAKRKKKKEKHEDSEGEEKESKKKNKKTTKEKRISKPTKEKQLNSVEQAPVVADTNESEKLLLEHSNDEDETPLDLLSNKKKVKENTSAPIEVDVDARVEELPKTVDNSICNNKKEDKVRILVSGGDKQESERVYLPEEFSNVLKPHQIEGIQFLWSNTVEVLEKGCILADSMGLGKTIQSIAFICAFLQHRLGKCVLIICPATLISNWEREFNLWLTITSKPNIYSISGRSHSSHDMKLNTIKSWYTNGGVLLLGFEMFRLLSNKEAIEYLANPGPDLVIVDEAHRLANPNSQITEAVKRIRTNKRIALTGYPLQNRLSEYWTMLDFVRPEYLGSLAEFRAFFETPINNGLTKDCPESLVMAARARMYTLTLVLKPFVKRRDFKFLESQIPKKHEFIISLCLTPLQIKLYKAFMEHRGKSLGKDAGGASILKASTVLLPICNHPDVVKLSIARLKNKKNNNNKNSSSQRYNNDMETEENVDILMDIEGSSVLDDYAGLEEVLQSTKYEEGSITDSYKMVALFQIIQQCKIIKEKLLIFSQSLLTLDTVEYFIRLHNNKTNSDRISHFRLDGTTPFPERQRLINEFNNPNCTKDIFLLSTRAGGLGINLTSASRVVILDACWNPSHDIESIFRVYRYGQQKEVYVYRFIIAGALESKIYEKQVIKQSLFKSIVDETPTRRSVERTYGDALIQYVENPPLSETKIDIAKEVLEDPVLIDLINNHSNKIVNIYSHESLLGDDETGLLSDTDKQRVGDLLQEMNICASHAQAEDNIIPNSKTTTNTANTTTTASNNNNSNTTSPSDSSSNYSTPDPKYSLLPPPSIGNGHGYRNFTTTYGNSVPVVSNNKGPVKRPHDNYTHEYDREDKDIKKSKFKVPCKYYHISGSCNVDNCRYSHDALSRSDIAYLKNQKTSPFPRH